MKGLYLHQVNISVVCAKKELVQTQCIIAFRVTGCTKDATVWRKDWVIYLILNTTSACSSLREMIHIRSNLAMLNMKLSISHVASETWSELKMEQRQAYHPSQNWMEEEKKFRKLQPLLTSRVFSRVFPCLFYHQ